MISFFPLSCLSPQGLQEKKIRIRSISLTCFFLFLFVRRSSFIDLHRCSLTRFTVVEVPALLWKTANKLVFSFFRKKQKQRNLNNSLRLQVLGGLHRMTVEAIIGDSGVEKREEILETCVGLVI